MPALGDNLSAWTTWDGTSDISATNGYHIAVAETESDFTCERVGQTTVVARIQSNITYMDGSDEITGLTPATYLEGIETDLPATATKEHYTFDGWFMSSAGTGDRQYTIPATSTGNVTRYAKFTGEELTVTKTLTGMTFTGEDNANYGTAYGGYFSPNEGKVLPDDVTITVGGVTLTKGTDYSYAIAVGPGGASIATLQINANKVTGAITITGTATDAET